MRQSRKIRTAGQYRKRNIVYYVTRQYMRQNKKRTITTFAGIVFMVLLMTCVFVGKDTGVAYLEEVASLKEGKWHVSMYGITEDEYEQVKNLPYAHETAISTGYGCTAFAKSGNEGRPYLNVKGYGDSLFGWMNIEISEGRLPENEHETLFLNLIMGHSPVEIAGLYGISSNTARQQIFRAKQHLKQLLENEEVNQ